MGAGVALLQDELGAVPNPQGVAAEEEHHDDAHADAGGEAFPDAGAVRSLERLAVLLHRQLLASEGRDLRVRSMAVSVLRHSSIEPPWSVLEWRRLGLLF